MGMSYKIQGKNIYLDANIFIYLLEGYCEFVPFLTQLLNQIDDGILNGVTSELTLAETLAKPAEDKNFTLQKAYENTIKSSTMLHVAPVSREILIAAAKIRSKTIRLPDAIHLATAYANNCRVFLTNDKRLKTNDNLKIVLISEIKDSILIVE